MKTIVRALSAFVAVSLVLILVPVSPALGDGCTDKCGSQRASCDRGCDQKKFTCIAGCGIPLTPGYDKCTQKCNDDQSRCQLQCQAEEKVCEVRCKVGQ